MKKRPDPQISMKLSEQTPEEENAFTRACEDFLLAYVRYQVRLLKTANKSGGENNQHLLEAPTDERV